MRSLFLRFTMTSNVGTTLQILNKGLADRALSDKAKCTYWKHQFTKISDYAVETETEQSRGAVFGKEFTVEINSMADLINDIWLTVDIAPLRLKNPGRNDTVHWSNALGHAMLSRIAFKVGNTVINAFDGRFMEILHEIESEGDKDLDDFVLRSKSPKQLVQWAYYGTDKDRDGNPVTRLLVHLPFYFTRALSQAFPVCSLGFGGVMVQGELRKKRDLMVFSNPNNTELDPEFNGEILDVGVMMQNVYLTEVERTLFTVNPHEYIFDNPKWSEFNIKPAGADRMSVKITDFLYPVKYLMMAMVKDSNIEKNDYFNFELTEGQGDDPFLSMGMKLGVAQREARQTPRFWRKVQAAKYFNRTPERPVFLYSFGQFPLEWYPSGSVNMSRIQDLTLDFKFPRKDGNGQEAEKTEVIVWAVYTNFLRFSRGQVNVLFA
ncbi:major capsid protein [Sicyoidochytrium minutum DNA virus]|nr:major capsid protein [Sicyoidochytrium minutum DNA virus]